MKSITETLEEYKAKICDEYCKYPAMVHEKWLSDELETDKDEYDYLCNHYCVNCPLTDI